MNDFPVIARNRTFLKNSSRVHEWATPFAIGAFALTALTGILLFFKVHLGMIKPVHEWLSWLLVIGTAFHILVNWRATMRYFSRPVGRGILLVFFLLICASLLPVNEGGEQRHQQTDAVSKALLQTPLSTVAQVAQQDPENTIDLLKAQGLSLTGWHQTLQEIADANNQRAADILALIFKNEQ